MAFYQTIGKLLSHFVHISLSIYRFFLSKNVFCRKDCGGHFSGKGGLFYTWSPETYIGFETNYVKIKWYLGT